MAINVLRCVLCVGVVMLVCTAGACSHQCVAGREGEYGLINVEAVRKVSQQMDETLSEVRNNHPVVQEFERIFPDARHFITGFVGDNPKWTSQASLYDRYTVAIRFALNDVESMPSMIFVVQEIDRFERRPGGVWAAYYGQLHRMWGADEWKVLVEAEGDWAALGLTLRMDDPIENFEEATRLHLP